MRRFLVTGSSGMLGKDICEVLFRSKEFLVFGIDRVINPHFPQSQQIIGNLTDYMFLSKALNDLKPQAIIHCAAIVNVDDCESNRNMADTLHRDVSRILATYMKPSTRFIYISTDSVFDGEKGDYKETDIPNPINYYAKSKREGEIAVLANNPNSVIIRTNIYGFNHVPKKSLVEWAIKNLEQQQTITGFTDVYFNPVYTKELARFINELVNKVEFAGILNVASQAGWSKYDFLVQLAETFQYDTNLVKKGSVNNVNFSAPRPLNTTLNTDLLRSLFNKTFFLNDGLSELKKDYCHFKGKHS